MRQYLLAIGLWLLAVSGVSANSLEPIEKNYNFTIFIDQREVGQHQFSVAREGETIRVASTMALNFTVLLVKKVSYQHRANEIWQNGCITQLISETTRQGKTSAVDARGSAIGSGLLVVRGDETEDLSGCVRGFAYWDPALLEGEFLLNADSGKYVPVEINTTVAEDSSKSIVIKGPKLQIELQYSAEGEWLSLESELKIGGTLRYQRTF